MALLAQPASPPDRVGQALEWVGQESEGILVCGGIWEMCGRFIRGHGLMVGHCRSGSRLYLMVLKVFSNLNDSMNCI